MLQLKELDKQLRDANRTIEAKMRALDEQGLVAVDLSSKLKEANRELHIARKEIKDLKERGTALRAREVSVCNHLCSIV